MAGTGEMPSGGEPSTGPTSVLILRAWSTAGDDGRHLVVRLTSRIDVESDVTETSVAGTIDEVVARVRAWLGDIFERVPEVE